MLNDIATAVPESEHAIAYATPEPPPVPRAGAGAAIVFGALGLVLLGGCFLIGVLLLVRGFPDGEKTLDSPEVMLMVTLYILAFASFTGAAAMLLVGTRALLRILRS